MMRGGKVAGARARARLMACEAGSRAAAAALAAALVLCALVVAPAAAKRGQSESDRIRMYHENHGNEWPFDTPFNYRDPRELAQREAEVLAMDNMQDKWDTWMRFSQEMMTPNMTAKGVQVEELPKDIMRKLYDFVHDNMDKIQNEGDEFEKASAITSRAAYPGLLDLPPSLKHEIAEALKPIHERWCNCKLKFNALYGIRVYYEGCVLACHLDRTETHVVSSIMHIAHDLREPWPVEIKDHFGRFHSVNLDPGEMLHYESAKLVHCRGTQLKGSWYANAFIHYAPVDWKETVDDTEVAVPPFWQYGALNVPDPKSFPAFAMLNGTTPGSPEREQMIVDTVRRQRDRRGMPRDPLIDPTREADEEAARLREAANAIVRKGAGSSAGAVSRRSAIETSARVGRGGGGTAPLSEWRRWAGWALIGAAFVALALATLARGPDLLAARRASRAEWTAAGSALHGGDGSPLHVQNDLVKDL